MTEMQQWQPPAEVAPVTTLTNTAVHNLMQWAEHAGQVYRLAEMLCGSSFVPQAFKGKPIEGAAAIMAGAEVGMSPVTSLRAFDVIQGQATARAITLRAIVQSHGHEVVLVESTSTRCKMRGRRKGTDTWQDVSWTIDRAKDLQLTGKDNWKKQPAAMLVARATSEICRLIAADAILGIGYSTEEVADGAGVDLSAPAVDGESQPGTRRMSRKRAEPAPEPDPVADAETGEVAGITPQQSKALHAAFNNAGVKDREQRLAYCRNLIGRDLASSSDLTKVEASAVIDALHQDAQDAPADALPPMFDPDAE